MPLWKCRVVIAGIGLLLPMPADSLVYQSPVQVGQSGAKGVVLTPTEEKDSYEIYSMLLKTEMPPQWNIAAWVITQETQTYPAIGTSDGAICLQPAKEQESTYLPLIQDFVAKNRKKLVLEYKFDLPQYALVAHDVVLSALAFNASVLFHVSAVGFNRDHTRALVYVGHHCGSLCGGGTYHLLVKKDGPWRVDREYRGVSCAWAS